MARCHGGLLDPGLIVDSGDAFDLTGQIAVLRSP